MLTLYDYFRSSAAYRVRIALNMKGATYRRVAVSLVDNAQHDADYRARTPQGLVPALDTGDGILTQSLAIIDWLDATQPGARLIPADPMARARALAMAQLIACDIHPLNNLRVLRYLEQPLGLEKSVRDTWYAHWIHEGFAALERMAGDGPFLGGDAPDVADIFLVPQMANARRFDVDLAGYPRLIAADARACALPPFAAAHPDRVKPEA
jgi:maleylacetoacetate isomerase